MRKTMLTVLCGLALLLVLALTAGAEDQFRAIPIPDAARMGPSPPQSQMAACVLSKTNSAIAGYFGGFEIGMSNVTYYDPAMCGISPTYPFEITAFDFTLYDDGTVSWPVQLDVVVYDMALAGDSCAGLGQELCRITVSCDSAGYMYPAWGTVTFPDPCCVTGPFYAGLEYTDQGTGPFPSILFDDQLPDTCNNWFYYAGVWNEWYDIWSPPPVGNPLFQVSGETNSAICMGDTCSWEPGDPHKMHYPQLPDELGWDVNATAPVVLADDWTCSETGWIKDFHWWGSWKHGAEGVIDYFVLSYHTDIPADQSGTGYSMPGITLWEYEVHDFDVTPFDPPSMEGWYDPSTGEVIPDDHQAYFRYDVCIVDDTMWPWQDSGVVYWLNISAVVSDPTFQWGWKSSIDHHLDDAVWAYWGALDWIEMYEPDVPSDPVHNDFWVTMLPDGMLDPSGSGGTDFYGDGWYYYPMYDWWNIWFYDHPFDYERYKTVHLEFDVFPLDPGAPMWFEIAVNWSTDIWSIEFPGMGPPLPGVDEDLYIGRHVLYASDYVEGHLAFDWEWPDYNPEWVSIDVRGFNFAIPMGMIEHDCRALPQSLDLSFVVTGGPPLADSGACCYDDPTGMGWTCVYTTQDECENQIGGVYEGDGVQCEGVEACCLPDNTCVMADALCCRNELGGIPQGPGSICLGVEACCLGDNTCVMADALCCINELGGAPQGPGSVCLGIEACCLPDNTCLVADAVCCLSLGGIPQGPGSQCAGIEACCLPNGDCVMADALCCVNQLGGAPQGAGTVCTALEACCLPDGSCQDLDPLCCADMGGTPQGAGTDCSTTECITGWEPGDPHKMHYPQLPDEAGWDVNATIPVVLADDWMCSETGWVKDIHWWGSWMHGAETDIEFFVLSIHRDIPAAESPTGWSMPGPAIWEREITDFNPIAIDPPSMEGWYNPASGDVFPNDHQAYYQYNVYLDSTDWLWQDSGTIYWLNISAVYVDTSFLWGWKSSINHFNDDAVWAEWGDLNWVEMYEPDGGSSDPIVNSFYVIMDEYGQVIGGAGQDAFGDGWYYYPWYDWWNIWFYDHPFDPARYKTIHIEIDVFPNVGGPGWFELAVNWSTDRWSLDFPGIDRPPLPGEDEDLYIGREILYASDYYEGHFVFDWVIPDYNPEWVSIDIRGFNFIIPEGFIEHACVGTSDPQSLDLSFVITGDTIGGIKGGACCDGDGGCFQLTETDCLALGPAAVFRGLGTSCLGDSEPNGYDDACECCGLYTGGITGNANCSIDGKLTLSDITRMIDKVYISKLPLCCEASGNTNASADCKITLSDITVLIDAVYISKTPPNACMPSCY